MSPETFRILVDELCQFSELLTTETQRACSATALETYREELKTLWGDLKARYSSLIMDTTQTFEDKDEVRNLYKTVFPVYVSCMERIGSPILPQATTFLPPVASSPHIISEQRMGLSLPPIDTEPFDGDYSKWPTFRDHFTTIYIENHRISAIERLLHLRNKTKGEANEIVSNAPLTHDGFAVAWNKLVERYENKRLLVNNQLQLLFNLPSFSSETCSTIKQLQREINGCISALQLLQIDVKSWDPIFVYLCTTRLSETTLGFWEESLKNHMEIPTWDSFDSFLSRRFHALESVSAIYPPSSSRTNRNYHRDRSEQTKPVRSFHTNVSPPMLSNSSALSSNNKSRPSSHPCRLCPSEFHSLRHCPRFSSKSFSERWMIIQSWGLCYNCLAFDHKLSSCKSRFTCARCRKPHNTLLHEEETSSLGSSVESSSVLSGSRKVESITDTPLPSGAHPDVSKQLHSCLATHSVGVLLGTALVSIIKDGIHYTARALLDSGSESSFISERLFRILKIPHQSVNAQISGVNNQVTARSHKSCNVMLSSPLDTSHQIPLSALILPNLVGNLPSFPVKSHIKDMLPDLPLADPNFYLSTHIDLLLGGDAIPKVMLKGVRRDVCESLLAQETIFGWILSGPVPPRTIVTCLATRDNEDEQSLDKTLRSFWEIENVPCKRIPSEADTFCEENFVQTTKRSEDGRYIVSLPFKPSGNNPINIGESRSIAHRIFSKNEVRLEKSPELKGEYDSVLQEYVSLQHMELVKSMPSPHFYLPHHAVIKPDSTTTKVRVVFNASQPSSTGLSLNDLLYPGPVLQTDLTLLLVKWRFFKYVFNGDIEKMYRQIRVSRNHTPYQRIIFRDPKTKLISDYELCTVTFGVNCAPYLAIRTLRQLADDVESKFPLASDILRNYMYVDDALGGAHDLASAKRARDELIDSLTSAGFHIRKWTSNSHDILDDIPIAYRLNEMFLQLDDSSQAKTLGIRWNALQDSFYFWAKDIAQPPIITKRAALSQIAKLFDPAGWLSPFIILAKILMQEIWISQVGWDEEITPLCTQKWRLFLENYTQLNLIQIPRWINYSPSCRVQFHSFSDASEKAFAAAIYIRVELDAEIYTRLVVAKSKVAPVKTLSLPRLELCGAVLLADLADFYIPQLDVSSSERFYWTDSMIVLAWLKKPPCHWTTFVANRISKISQTVGVQNWFHVTSESNPADLATRGLYPNDLCHNTLWWNGPGWLSLAQSQWPSPPKEPLIHTEIELKPIKSNIARIESSEEIFTRFSSFSRAIRVLAYMLRWVANWRNNHSFPSKLISRDEFREALNRAIMMCQRSHFSEELGALRSNRTIPTSSDIFALNPFIDNVGMLRVSGRLTRAPSLRYDESHPIILPYKSQLSRLYVQFVHIASLHGENHLILRLIRLRFWIPRAKNLIKSILHKCKVCLIHKQKFQAQLMGSLPPERTLLTRPFTNTGIDFAGPFDVRSSHLRKAPIYKAYVCVFVCFATKGIHLEATSSLATDVFKAALDRFIARRGCPDNIYSDNGKTFVGAERVAASELLECCRNGIFPSDGFHHPQWHFIPPAAPHMGGLWEAAVKSFKAHFKKVAGSFAYTMEEFSTLLARIEACLNSRPISSLSDSPDDCSALTPGHFLTGAPLLAPPEKEIHQSPIAIINRWQRLKAIYQSFCSRWKSEYLLELHRRSKWKTPCENLKKDDLVIVQEANLSPNEWRLGRIIEVLPGKDGKVRVAEVRTQRGNIRRPVVKLILLPKEESD